MSVERKPIVILDKDVERTVVGVPRVGGPHAVGDRRRREQSVEPRRLLEVGIVDVLAVHYAEAGLELVAAQDCFRSAGRHLLSHRRRRRRCQHRCEVLADAVSTHTQ